MEGVLEELCWLEEMAAHLLADTGDGEVPQLPSAVAAAIEDKSAEQAVCQLSHLLLSIPGLCLDPSFKHLASPRYLYAFTSMNAACAHADVKPEYNASQLIIYRQ